MDKLSV